VRRPDGSVVKFDGNAAVAVCGVCSEVRGENVLSFIGRGPQTAVGTFLERSLRESAAALRRLPGRLPCGSLQ